MRSARAKLFRNGGSQAVRLPKACRFPAQQEVLVRREGRRVILEPAAEWPEEFRACLGAGPVLPFDQAAADRFGPVASALARRGEPIGTFDTLIAAHALSCDLTLVTNNTKHFP